MDLVPGPFSASSIAALEAVAVADITNPTELNSLAGTVNGERRVCYQVVANDNLYTVYFWDSADGAGASSPYVVAGSAGYWIAAGGRYTNSAESLRGALSVDIGTASGARPAAAIAAPLNNTTATFFATDAQFPRVWGEAYGNTGLVITGRAISGTRAAPTATTTALGLFAITATGYDGTSYLTAGRAQYAMFAGSLWTASNHETYHEWRATANGSTTNTTYMQLRGGGRLLVGTTLPTDDGTSALQVTGAAAIAGAVTLTGNSLTMTSSSVQTFTLNDTNTASSSWAIKHLANGDLQIIQPSQNNWITLTHASGAITSLGPASITDSTASSSTITGAFKVTGGIGIGGNAYIGGATISLTAGTASTSATTGNLIVVGGVGIGGAVFTSGAIQTTLADATIGFRVAGATGRMRVRGYVDATNGCVVESTNTSEASYLPLSFGASIYRFFTGAVTNFLDTTDATDSAHAAVVVTGGVAMGKNLWVGADAAAGSSLYLNCAAANGAFHKFMSASVLRWQFGRVGSTHDFQLSGYDSGGTLTDVPLQIANAAGGAFTIVRPVSVTSTTDSSSTSTGALIVSGGMAVAKAAFIGTSATATALTVVAGTTAASYQVSDSGTTNQPQVFVVDHTSSGTPAASFGTRFYLKAKSDTTASRAQGNIATSWVVATDASRTGRLVLYASDFANDSREGLRIEASGSAPLVGLYGTAAVAQYATTGTSTGFTAGAGTTVTHLSTFTGNTGSAAYTIGDIVRALKLIGAIAS